MLDHAEDAYAIIGDSDAMHHLREQIAVIARADAPVLITGPTGSGKELVAQHIHRQSANQSQPLVAVNCAAIPDTLVESELFGHERGSFTGADTRRTGRFEQARRGTLFLDEIGEMSTAVQARLLRAVETRQFMRVGGGEMIPVNARIIAATHRSLGDDSEPGAFREDLFYRLAVFAIDVPPLADHRDDIPALLDHLSPLHGNDRPCWSPAILAKLMAHDWPGNVRELRNVAARAAALFKGAEVDVAAFDALVGNASRSRPDQPQNDSDGSTIDLAGLLAKTERTHLAAALAAAHGIVSDAARLVEMKRSTFADALHRHDLRATRPV